jgi:hypothetical protein
MEFETLEIDYGKVKIKDRLDLVFKFANTDNKELIIEDVRSNCGCLVPDYPKEPIRPGEGNQIRVAYEATKIGPFKRTITVKTRGGETVILTVKGEVLEER